MKRIAAWIGIGLLVALYIVTFILALMAKQETFAKFFNLSLYLTFIIPALIYIYGMIYKLVHKNDEDKKQDDEKEKE